jgi:hypothetical protein
MPGEAPPANRRVSDLVEFWCTPKADAAQNPPLVSGVVFPSEFDDIIASFKDADTLDAYLVAHSGWNIHQAIWDRHGKPMGAALMEDMPSLLAFPSRMGMDPSDPETVRWAKAFVPHHAGGTYEYRQRAEQGEVVQLYKAGVPLEYALALDTDSWRKKMPVGRIIPLYQSGIAVEYARELLYGAKP